ncbi:hypothetical protein [Tabrizicola flagellatus]|uniref:hypothetical protein n=1 Tax=Tabrizicola flagellatus TaxID=2593021 RepID=UPI0011F3E223|nr:hypothetical protein [Tabrizicola flagellatus]
MIGSSAGKAARAGLIALGCLAGAGALWVWGRPWVLDINDPAFNPMLFLIVLLATVGLWHGAAAALSALRQRAFGAVVLEIDGPGHLRPGSPLSGRLRSARPVAATGPFRLLLTCHDVHMFEDNEDGPRLRSFPVWSHEIELPAASDTQQGLAFRFDVPRRVGPDPVPEGRRRAKAARVAPAPPGARQTILTNVPPVDRVWTLTVTAPVRGPDFRAELHVPDSAIPRRARLP